MKKTVSILIASLLVSSAFAGEKMVVASAAKAQTKAVKVEATKHEAAHDYALESFSCCGLPQ